MRPALRHVLATPRATAVRHFRQRGHMRVACAGTRALARKVHKGPPHQRLRVLHHIPSSVLRSGHGVPRLQPAQQQGLASSPRHVAILFGSGVISLNPRSHTAGPRVVVVRWYVD